MPVQHLPAPETISEREFDKVFDVNCKSVYLMAREFVPHLQNKWSYFKCPSTDEFLLDLI